MIKREENILNNSIAYNVINDNLVAKNYLALAYCVVGIELFNIFSSRFIILMLPVY